MLVLALLAPVVPGSADEQEEEPKPIGGLTFVDEVEVTIANLVVYVTDKKGNAITDLTKDDFEVFQDGEEKQITNFKLYTQEIIRHQMAAQEAEPLATPTTPEVGEPEGPIPVHMVLYIDNENLEPLDRNRVLSQTREFVRKYVHPPTQMMVVAYQRSFKVIQEFTSDPNEVLAAMRSLRTYTGGRTETENQRGDIVDTIHKIEQENRSGSRYSPDQGSGSEWSEAFMLIDNFAKEEVNDMMFTFDALRGVITTLSGLPGKKGIVYVSNGLPMTAGLDLFYELSRVTQRTDILSQMFDYDLSRQYQQLVAAANAQDVTFYSISATGLEVSGMGVAERSAAMDPLAASVGTHNYTDSLRYMSDETGGIAIINTNDVSLGLERVAQDMYTYYSLGYPLHASGQDKVHKVKVEIPSHPEYQIRYRPRFVEKSRETKVQDAVVSSLAFEIDDNPMQLEIETGTPAPASEKRWILPTHISFPLDKIALYPEGDEYVGRVVLFVAVRDRDGRRSDLVRQEHEVRIPAKDYELAATQRWGIDTRLLMEPGSYKVAVAILDQVTHQDSYETVSVSVNPAGK
jgi:VWFA-related protein